jgi:hypothetical protein
VASLASVVGGHVERHQLVERGVLHLVDEDDGSDAEVGCGVAQLGEEVDEVDGEVT